MQFSCAPKGFLKQNLKHDSGSALELPTNKEVDGQMLHMDHQ